MKTLKNIAAVACVTALAVPAGVSAKGPNGDHGKSGQHKQTTQTTHVSNRCKNQPKVGFVLRGTLDPSSTADNIVVVVKSANKHSRQFVADGKYTVAGGSTTAFEGANPFTTAGADLSKYKVKVVGKVIKYKRGCTAVNAPAPTVRKVTVTAPEATTEQQQTAAHSA